MNKTKFFEEAKRLLFNGKLSQDQVNGLEAVIDEWNKQGGGQRQQLAYVLATPYHEVGPNYKPIRENMNYTSVASLRRVWPKRFPSDASAKPYVGQPKKLAIFVYGGRLGNAASPSEDGWIFRGGGWPQTTGKENFAKFGLADSPDMILQPKVSAVALVKGMKQGMYTGKKLSDFINGSKVDYFNARTIINADKSRVTKTGTIGSDIAEIAKKFDAALAASGYSDKPATTVTKPANNTTVVTLIVGAIVAIGVWLKSIGILP